MKRILIVFVLVLSMTFIYETVISFINGIGGHTRKNAGTAGDGCICHMADSTSSVIVRISGPVQVAPNSVNIYRITMRGGPAVTGGFDFNVKFGSVDTVPGQQTIRIIQTFDSINDISQRLPQNFSGDSASWQVKYIAPNTSTVIYDTLYATGNSTNNNGNPDDGDKWNFSPNFVVEVNPSIGIQQISTIAERYSLGQNYPNPFNPATQFEFRIAESGFVSLRVYDALGKQVETLVNEELHQGVYKFEWNASKLASGVYYYRLASGKFSEVKKMVLVK